MSYFEVNVKHINIILLIMLKKNIIISDEIHAEYMWINISIYEQQYGPIVHSGNVVECINASVSNSTS